MAVTCGCERNALGNIEKLCADHQYAEQRRFHGLIKRADDLEAALRPLAEACLAEMGDGRDADEPDDGNVFAGEPDGQGITFGMIRRAMAALENKSR